MLIWAHLVFEVNFEGEGGKSLKWQMWYIKIGVLKLLFAKRIGSKCQLFNFSNEGEISIINSKISTIITRHQVALQKVYLTEMNKTKKKKQRYHDFCDLTYLSDLSHMTFDLWHNKIVDKITPRNDIDTNVFSKLSTF